MDVVQLEGVNFGVNTSALAVRFWIGTVDYPSTVCLLTHTLLRLGVSIDRANTYNLSVTVAGQLSNVETYSYAVVMKPPVFTSIFPTSGPTMVRLLCLPNQ